MINMYAKIGLIVKSNNKKIELIIDNEIIKYDYNKIFKEGSLVVVSITNNKLTIFKIEEII